MNHPPKAAAARARQRLYRAIRAHFEAEGFDEVETPNLVVAPGMEPHINLFEATFLPETGVGTRRTLYLHSSPEYAMKRLLAAGWERIFQIGKVFRNGEIAKLHNPEFTMLEFYRANVPGHGPLLRDIEQFTLRAAEAIAGSHRVIVEGTEVDLEPPWERLTVADAFRSRTGIELPMDGDTALLRSRARAAGFDVSDSFETYDDIFFSIFLTAIEPTLGRKKPTFLVDYPACMASLSKLREDDPNVAERFELYVAGTELANGFYELTDAAEQRRRLVEEQELRHRLGRPVYPLDERFLAAVGRMPPSAGVAVGLDRLLMVLGGFATIDEVLLFPLREELA
jgi:lysyl-tRNA synthetase class 2